MRLIILGAGGYGKTVADIARQSENMSRFIFWMTDRKRQI